MKMRWSLTWRKSEIGKKAKMELVLLGYTAQDHPTVQTAKTESPTPGRRARFAFYMKAAQRGWTAWLADSKPASQEDRQIFTDSVREPREAMSLGDAELVQVAKAAYRLTDAPQKCFKEVRSRSSRQKLDSGDD